MMSSLFRLTEADRAATVRAADTDDSADPSSWLPTTAHSELQALLDSVSVSCVVCFVLFRLCNVLF
jgi:hypothetical protein